MSERPVGGFPLTNSWSEAGVAHREAGPAYAEMIEALRVFLDRIAGAKPDDASVRELEADLRAWNERLAMFQVSEHDQVFAHQFATPGRGQTMSPAFRALSSDAQGVTGVVRFGRYFLGGGGAVHGGAIPLLFDEVLGRLASTGGRSRARTAYLHVDYRAVTPTEVDLDVRGWFVSEAGRKRVLRAELRHGSTLCAEAEGLFVELRPGQP
jgi:acyl-coenzyme A thioesterase PaaI-like protein